MKINFGKWVFNVIVIFIVLFILSLVGAVRFPALPGTVSALGTFLIDALLLLVSVIVIALVGAYLGKGIKSMKSQSEAVLFSYLGALIIGGILALLTLLNFPFAARLNLQWLGANWYDAWITVFLIGATLVLAFVVSA